MPDDKVTNADDGGNDRDRDDPLTRALRKALDEADLSPDVRRLFTRLLERGEWAGNPGVVSDHDGPR